MQPVGTARLAFITNALSLSDNRFAAITSTGGSSANLQFWTSNGAAPAVAATIAADRTTTWNGNQIISVGGGTAAANTNLVIANGTTSMNFVPQATAGAWNPLVQTNDSLIWFTSAGTVDTGNLVIGPWTSGYAGMRMWNTGCTAFTASDGNQILMKYSNTSTPTVIHRNDGSNYYILLTAAGTTASSSWNGLRPLFINTSTGMLNSNNGQTFYGGITNNGYANFYGDGTNPGLDASTPNNGSTGGIRLRGNATSGNAYIQITDSSAASQWGLVTWASSGAATFSSQVRTSASGFYAASDWYRLAGGGGFYWESYGRGVQSADTGGGSYGNFAVYGTGLNGWQGVQIGGANKTNWMTDNSTLFGMYDNTGAGWLIQCDFSGNFTAKGNVTAYSDLRLKENVRPIPDVEARRDTLAAAAIMYERDGRTRIGYGAQMLRDNGCPEFVREADDAMKLATGLGTLSVDYGETAAVLAAASKNTDNKVAALEDRVSVLQETIDRLTTLLESRGIA
jgi:hypothetical protein